MIDGGSLFDDLIKNQMHQDYIVMIDKIIKEEFHKTQPPRELNQKELAQVIYNIAKTCFSKGYETAISELTIDTESLCAPDFS